MSKRNNSNKTISATDQQQLNVIRSAIQDKQKIFEQTFCEMGDLLSEAKHILTRHGEWQKWIRDNTDFSITKAERLIKASCFVHKSAPELNLNFSQAYVLTTLPPNAIDKFLAATHLVEKKGKYMHVQEMSKRELEEAVRKFLNTYNTDSSSAPAPKKTKSPAASKNDFNTNYKKTQDALTALVTIVDKDPTPSNSRNRMIADLCDLCTGILQKFAVRDMDTF